MVSTKHCCWGECKSDARYPEKLPKHLQEMMAAGQKVFLPFPKASQGLEKCQLWVTACSRENFTVKSITRNTYICLLHWPGERGRTEEFPDPLKANFTKKEVEKASTLKRGKPRVRTTTPEQQQKRRKLFDTQLSESYDGSSRQGSDIYSDLESELSSGMDLIEGDQARSGKDVGTQTEISKYLLSAKINTMLLRNEVALMKSDQKMGSRTVSSISYEMIANDSALMKHFVGLSAPQFEALHNFLNSVCPFDEITYWYGKEKSRVGEDTLKPGAESQFSTRESLFICLLRLKSGFTIKTMSVLLSSPDRPVKETMIRKIFTTYIQLMYKIFRDMETMMFPTRDQMSSLPKVFKSMENIRCIVDCTEFKVEMSRDYARQGNTYSSYKHSNTFKCLIAVTPHGGACFVSDLFEGDIDDVKIFQESGILKHIRPNDLILGDRGFTVQDLLNPLQAKVKIPAFLKGRDHLTVAEELETRKIAKARIHVERFNQRLKQFALVGRKIPLSLSPLATQMVVVACGLVNFQNNLCK